MNAVLASISQHSAIQPEIRIRPRSPEVEAAALAAGFSPLQSRLLAGRLPTVCADHIEHLIHAQLSRLTPPDHLPDIEVAVAAIADAIESGVNLILSVDYDCDGTCSGATLYRCLTEHFNVPSDRVHILIAHRKKDGYGLSQNIADHLIDTYPSGSLVITADQGSSDHARVAHLTERGFRVVITDHHGVPDHGPPPQAVACVNPCRADSIFPDRNIAGAAVAWLVMCALRNELIERGYLPVNAPKLTRYLSYVACSTIADCVSIGTSINNRAYVTAGLVQMNAPDAFPCWQAMRRLLGIDRPITAKDIAFSLAPRLNVAGRLQHARMGVDWLLASDFDAALECARKLDAENAIRQRIERAMRDELLPAAREAATQGAAAIVAFSAEGNQGVMGIVASRLVEATGRPAAVFVPKEVEPKVATGSLRSIPGVNVRDVLAELDHNDPTLFAGHGYGGHAAAAGAHLNMARLPDFMLAFECAVAARVNAKTLRPVVWVDGPVPARAGLPLLSEIAVLEPYGREFESPVFSADGIVRGVLPRGDGSHLLLTLLLDEGGVVEAIWFRARSPGHPAPVQEGDRCALALEPAINTYNGRSSLQWLVKSAAVQTAT